jgi:hypothetical protein
MATLLLAAASTALAWLVAELILRLAPPTAMERLQSIRQAREGAREVHPRGLYRLDAKGLWTLAPGFRGTFRGKDFAVDVEANSEGLRDREFGEKPAGVFRILGLGDSFAFGWGVENRDSYLKLLETRLSSTRGRLHEVVNAGIPGFGTYEELELLRSVGLSYRPDLVLLSFYEGNDYANNGDAPRSRLIEDGYLRDARTPPGLLSRISEHSVVIGLVQAAGSGFALKRRFRSDVEETKQRLAAMHSLLAARRIPMVLLLIPDQDPEAYRRPGVLSAIDRLASRTTTREARRELRALCESSGIPYCELSSRFEGAGAAAELRLIDTHWNRRGHVAAAEELLACLLPRLGGD